MGRVVALGMMLAAVAVTAVGFAPAPLKADKPAPPALFPAAGPGEPRFIDDDELLDRLQEELSALAAAKKCATPAELRKRLTADRTHPLELTKPGKERLDPEEVYERALKSVVVIGSVIEKGDGDYDEGRMATAWALTADGVFVTNCHVFDDLADGESFGILTADGEAFAVTDILALNRAADVAVFQTTAKGTRPLPLAEKPARVGAWVGVLGHPGDRYFTFTQGNVSRYTRQKRDDAPVERWMAITADYAYGASGSPVLDRTGAVVGMAALTENIDYPEDEAKPGANGSLLQMVVKLTTPGAAIKAAAGK